MEIRARVALSLPSTFYKITLKYDTFEKATYDSYLMASLVANSKNKTEAYNYIDEITGKGSLNSHFKKLYDQISAFTSDQINSILTNSLFPITVVDQKHHFNYYSMFKATRMDNKVFDGNLISDEEKLKSLIMPKGKDIKFLSLDYVEEPATIKLDNYNAIFSNDEIKVDLDNGQYYSISKEDFNEVHANDVINLGGYLGRVETSITEGSWNVLAKNVVDTFDKTAFTYCDSDNIHCTLLPNCIKTTEIIKIFDLFFYKETKYDFTKRNAKKCRDALNYLLESNKINEFKTKSLIGLLLSVDDLTAQRVVTYILSRKGSKEISEVGIRLIKSGLEKGWNKESLLEMKKQVPSDDYKYLYRIDSDLNFEIEDILDIDTTDLTEADRIRRNEYLSEKENMLKQMNLWIGEITNSGIREKIKLLSKSALKDSVKKFVDKRTGHNQKDYRNMNMQQLKKEYEEIKAMYNGDYQAMLKEIEKIEESK